MPKYETKIWTLSENLMRQRCNELKSSEALRRDIHAHAPVCALARTHKPIITLYKNGSDTLNRAFKTFTLQNIYFVTYIAYV
jgi:hypothetical protein